MLLSKYIFVCICKCSDCKNMCQLYCVLVCVYIYTLWIQVPPKKILYPPNDTLSAFLEATWIHRDTYIYIPESSKGIKFEPLKNQKQTWGLKLDNHIYLFIFINNAALACYCLATAPGHLGQCACLWKPCRCFGGGGWCIGFDTVDDSEILQAPVDMVDIYHIFSGF